MDASLGCGPVLTGIDHHRKPLRQQVFEFVRAAGQASRVEVARALGVSPGSITAIAAEFISAGYLREVEAPLREEAGRGRPPVALEVVSEAHHVIGIKISDEQYSAAVSDFTGHVLADATLTTRTSRKSANEMLDELAELLDLLLSQTQLRMPDIAAVGIGLSGLIDHQNDKVVWSPFLDQAGIPFKSEFEKRFKVVVHIDNDANVLTLSELWFGAGRNNSDFAVVTIEHGVGMGLVLNSQLFRGSRGMGLELGHTKVQLDGALCRCGQRGCLEAYLADYALVREASTALGQVSHNAQDPHATLETLYEQAKAGNLAAQAIFQRAGRFMALGLANVIQLFDPELIVLSGERMRYEYLYASEVMAEMNKLTLKGEGPTPRVEIHAWGDLVWARGAIALALSAVTDETFGGVDQ
ncbi:ROK family transcriptional regulator [Litoreibacter janthinus]|uniref:Sugar kinase of the NBD/HSP70 family, may contain an N-terminal HTH domain n=1 Tax=Litoreibacter janthinus TaxID=670154 RepID=A0A1I6FVN3_9RHOB|nr:ROK family transcriptional regulator [Litoreibacter janthinus]SFR34012.1 Sugar kinase of the NBD/HSP70 family, may contain an N-terminal HTH domain [Litoreibacter janthinus]